MVAGFAPHDNDTDPSQRQQNTDPLPGTDPFAKEDPGKEDDQDRYGRVYQGGIDGRGGVHRQIDQQIEEGDPEQAEEGEDLQVGPDQRPLVFQAWQYNRAQHRKGHHPAPEEQTHRRNQGGNGPADHKVTGPDQGAQG
jgi:hypothetical protein